MKLRMRILIYDIPSGEGKGRGRAERGKPINVFHESQYIMFWNLL